MGKHSTDISIELFAFLIELGKVLEYHTETEFPMSENAFGGQAIDIAWFNEKGNKFPLFIFEIESTSNNSIANNPTKVFGKDSKIFEKPLFFFHVIIDGAENSEKYKDLIGLFGKYNYDIFRINNGEVENLLLKIIAQHRRIHNHVDLYNIIRIIYNSDEIKSKIDFERILSNFEELIHEDQYYRLGQEYVNIASRENSFHEQYYKFLNRIFLSNSLPILSYESYFASISSEFVNLGILYSKFGKTMNDVDFLILINDAQKTESFKKIEYLPGLNRDYDIFIHDYVLFYIALTFFLFKGNINVQRYILDIALGIIRKLHSRVDFVFEHHVSWGLLMTASSEAFSEDFEELKILVNDNNGIFDSILYCPTFMNVHQKLPESKLIVVPNQSEYIETLKSRLYHLDEDKDICEIAIMSLSEGWKDETEYFFDLGVNLTELVIKSIS